MSGWNFISFRFCAGLIFGASLALNGGLSNAFAQTTLDAGKTPAQIFNSDCSPCHKSPQGLFKGAAGLSAFLRQHYTASKENAEALASYLGSVDKGGPASAASRKREAKPAAKKDGEKAEEKKSGAKAEGAKPESAKKSDAKPAAASSEEKPAEAKPAEAKPAEAKPAEAKPVEAKPVEAKPVEPKPAEAKPAEAPAAKPAE